MKRRLGLTDFQLNPIGLGAMPLSIQNRPSEAEALEVLKTAFKSGVNFIDTANAYCVDDSDTGHNERLIAKALREFEGPSKIVVATKGGCTRPSGEWKVDCRPESLRRACEKSLRDLGVEVIDLYYMHAVDARVPFEDSVGELFKLKEEGKILHIGLSNISTQHLLQALNIVRIEAVQNRFHPGLTQDLENGLISLCREQKISYVAHSPVGGHHGHKSLSKNKVLLDLSKKYRMSPYAIALEWILSLSEQSFVIPGASKASSILDSLTALQLSLEFEDRDKIEAIRG